MSGVSEWPCLILGGKSKSVSKIWGFLLPSSFFYFCFILVFLILLTGCSVNSSKLTPNIWKFWRKNQNFSLLILFCWIMPIWKVLIAFDWSIYWMQGFAKEFLNNSSRMSTFWKFSTIIFFKENSIVELKNLVDYQQGNNQWN